MSFTDPALDLAPLRMMVEEGMHNLSAPTTLEPISRPSSASTQASLAQLPGISALAMGTDGPGRSSPQPRPAIPAPATASLSTAVTHASSSPAATSTGGSTGNLPICQNCATSTTPLWRRDEMGSVLCNACGLFLKLHGRPRPISLKTDVIKSRNRVKTSMRPDMALKKKQNAAAVSAAVNGGIDHNGVVDLQNQAYAATAALSARRTSQKSANGHMDGADAALAGAASGMYGAHGPSGAYPLLDDGSQYQGQHLQSFASGAGGGQAGPVNGDGPHSQEQLIAANSSLKTRVAELEVINDFMQRRLGHYEPYVAQDSQESAQQAAEAQQLRSQVELLTQSETQLRSQIEESHRRENMLKRRLDELELELKEAKDLLSAYESGRNKKQRMDSSSASAPAADSSAAAPVVDGMAAAAAAVAAAAAAAAAAATATSETASDAGAVKAETVDGSTAAATAEESASETAKDASPADTASEIARDAAKDTPSPTDQ